tara:strand:+ start:324 stop:839 length:516 start_codon:yes stop_codon:yes gene_type:complete
MADRDIKNLEPDLNQEFNEAFNSMIGEVLADLVDESPVYTGFLASSWRAQKSQVRQKDRVEDHEPWAGIKANFVWKKKGDKPPNPEISPRFSPPTFDYRKGCFIGNQAEYSNYIIEDPGLVKYLKQDIQKTINRNFKEKKRGAIKIGSVQKKVLFGKGSKKGKKYTGTSEF